MNLVIFKMKAKLLLLLLVLTETNCLCYAQKIIIKGEETTRPLQWSDFTGAVDSTSPFFAYTWWRINYRIANAQTRGDSVIITSFEVRLELDPLRSWVKKEKETDDLLVHEQGHFNFGILCMDEFLAAYSKLHFTKDNLHTAIQNLFSAILKEYHDMGERYDQETNHGMNKQVQAKWNSFFREQLKEYARN